MTLLEVKDIAAQCMHYAMCRIDFLGTGVCPSGLQSGFASYYPQGRMEIVHALASGLIPLTERLVDVARSCTLCGRCDKQCYFLRELRPLKVMEALKQHVESCLEQGLAVVRPEEDDVVRRLMTVVGEPWATRDPAVLMTYSVDRHPLAERRVPRYVVMPKSVAEVVQVVRLARDLRLPYTARGHGSCAFGAALGDGIIIDLTRMKQLDVDVKNWTATVGPGVTGFELQRQAGLHGMRAAVVEPAACVCANIISTNMHSLFSYAYGMGGDHYTDAQFVGPDGEVFSLMDKRSPNPFHFDPEGAAPPGICTQFTVRLYPMAEDESAILVPFSDLREAIALARELARRRIGFAAGILGAEYTSAFMAPTGRIAEQLRQVFCDILGVEYGLLVLGDRHAVAAVKAMAHVTIDATMIRALMLGAPRFDPEAGWTLLSDLPGDKRPYEVLFRTGMMPLIQAALSPSPGSLADAVEEDMRPFYRELYARPEMTDLVWLNRFRILSARIGRGRAFQGMVMYLPLDDVEGIIGVCKDLKAIGERHGLKADFGCLIPVDFGKRAVMEYDFYHDHTDPEERAHARKAAMEASGTIDRAVRRMGGRSARVVPNQGHCRKENLLCW